MLRGTFRRNISLCCVSELDCPDLLPVPEHGVGQLPHVSLCSATVNCPRRLLAASDHVTLAPKASVRNSEGITAFRSTLRCSVVDVWRSSRRERLALAVDDIDDIIVFLLATKTDLRPLEQPLQLQT